MSAEKQQTIRASEVGSFLFCKRAWWYRLRGVKTYNEHQMKSGRAIHQQHGRQVFLSGLIRFLAIIAFLVALSLITVYLTRLLI
jgi:hypothetical protein